MKMTQQYSTHLKDPNADPVRLMMKDNPSPYIIAIFSKTNARSNQNRQDQYQLNSKQVKFFIHVENKLICVSIFKIYGWCIIVQIYIFLFHSFHSL